MCYITEIIRKVKGYNNSAGHSTLEENHSFIHSQFCRNTSREDTGRHRREDNIKMDIK
jgi:hypothetical protein